MRIPEDGTFGDTFFEARLRAIVAASFLNNPSCGYVDSVCTLADHFLRPCELRCEVLRVLLLLFLDVLLALPVFVAACRPEDFDDRCLIYFSSSSSPSGRMRACRPAVPNMHGAILRGGQRRPICNRPNVYCMLSLPAAPFLAQVAAVIHVSTPKPRSQTWRSPI